MKTKILIIAIIAGLALCGSLVAQSTASHNIVIRIIRTNQFAIQQDVVDNQDMQIVPSNSDQSDFNLDWKTSDCNKKITVASPSVTMKTPITIKVNDTPMQVQQTDTEILNGMPKTRGDFQLKYIAANTHSKSSKILYTMTDT